MASFSIGLSLLSSNMQKEPKRRELLSAEGRRILSLLEGAPPADPESLPAANYIAKDENGRPYFPDHRADFNISHSGAVTAVSLVKGDKLRTGCDVQAVKPRANTMKIPEGFFSAAEREYIFSREATKDNERKFFEIWTLKECFLKLRGLSVFDMQKAPSFVCNEGPEKGRFVFCAEVSTPLSFYVYELQSEPGDRYLLAVAIEGHEQPRPAIHWFSQSPLPVRSIAEIKAAASPAETVSPKI
jgi:phosphopantetheinyl transferase